MDPQSRRKRNEGAGPKPAIPGCGSWGIDQYVEIMEDAAYRIPGMTPGLFWSLTPKELMIMIKANHKRERDKDRRAAWVVASLANTRGNLREPIQVSDLFRE